MLAEFCREVIDNRGLGQSDKLEVCHRAFHALVELLDSVGEVGCADKYLADGALLCGCLFVNSDEADLQKLKACHDEELEEIRNKKKCEIETES